MALTPAQITTLHTELINDPNNYGYAPYVNSANDIVLANMLNLVRAEITVKNMWIQSSDVLEAIDSRDFNASPNIAHVAWFEAALNQGQIRLLEADGVTDTRALGNIKRIIGNTQNSTTRINAVANKLGSRAEQLLGVGTILSSNDVGSAR